MNIQKKPSSKASSLIFVIILIISWVPKSASSITPIEEGGIVLTKSGEVFSTVLTNNLNFDEEYQRCSYVHELNKLIGEDAILEVKVFNHAKSDYNLSLFLSDSTFKILEYDKELPIETSKGQGGNSIYERILMPNNNWTVKIQLQVEVHFYIPVLAISLPNKPNSTINVTCGDLPKNVTVWVTSILTLLDEGKPNLVNIISDINLHSLRYFG
ncbi:MAG: hypothetical protein ACW99Q_27360, partial [Candidatus Kariarchaeaceae archaeon]